MIKILLCFIYLVIIPVLIGLLITHFMKKEKNNLLYSVLLGYFSEFAIYQLLTIPCTFLGKSFNFLYYTCLVIFLGICIISLIVNKKEFKNIFYKIKDEIKETPKFLSLIAIVLIGIQCFVVFNYMHIDEDDSNFVAKATISLQTNSLYVYSDTGTVNETFPVRYVFSPFPVYTASIAKFTGYHPMAIAHTVLPVIISILIYINFYLLGTKLFNDKKKETWIFLIFINLIYIFGDFSLRTNFRFELVRLWQGKAVLGNLLIPSLIVVYDSFIQGETKFPYWISVFITMWASCLVSTMGFALAPIMLAGLTIVYWFRAINIGWPVKKELVRKTRNDLLKIGIKSVICCIPNFVYAIMYAIMKGGTTNG